MFSLKVIVFCCIRTIWSLVHIFCVGPVYPCSTTTRRPAAVLSLATGDVWATPIGSNPSRNAAKSKFQVCKGMYYTVCTLYSRSLFYRTSNPLFIRCRKAYVKFTRHSRCFSTKRLSVSVFHFHFRASKDGYLRDCLMRWISIMLTKIDRCWPY